MKRLSKPTIIAALAALLCVPTLPSRAQTTPGRGKVVIENVNVTRTGTILYITYDMNFGSGVQSCTPELNVSLDGGLTYTAVPASEDLTGDVGKMTSRGRKEIRYDIQKVKGEYAGRDIVFDVNARHVVALKPRVVATVGMTVYPVASSFGAMVGYVDKVGGYARFRSNFKTAAPTASYTCTSDGRTSDGGTFWGTGESSVSMLNVSAGVLFRAATWVYPYVGVGYGKRTVVWEDSNRQKVEVTDKSYGGVTYEAGAIFNIGRFSVSAGFSNLASDSGFGVDVGIGVNF